jgi:RimJ/RimL family protein N-acetyltransferase
VIDIPTLRTERLVLRPFRDEDLDAWAAIVGDPETAQFIGGVRSREDAWRSMAMYLGHWELRGYGQWAVERRLDGRLVGRAGLWYPEGWPELEVGWTLDRSVWGEGFATEAGQASIDWGFREIGLERIASVISKENSRSRAVAVRLGMDLDRELVLDGDPVVVYACDRPG